MTNFERVLSEIEDERAATQTKLAKLDAALEVLRDLDKRMPAAPAAPKLRRPPPTKLSSYPTARPKPAPAKQAPPPPAPAQPAKPDRRAAIAAAAAAKAPKAAPPKKLGMRPCGCIAKGRHRSDCPKAAPSKAAADPEPAKPAVTLAPSPPPPKRPRNTVDAATKGKAAKQRLHRCNVPIVEAMGALQRHRPCGETVWDADRAKHLRLEHGITIGDARHFIELHDDEAAKAA